MIRRDLVLLGALVLAAVMLVVLTRPLPEGGEAVSASPGAGRTKVEVSGVGAATVPADQSLLLGRPGEPAPLSDAWDRAVEALGPSLVAVESWPEKAEGGAVEVLRGCGIFVGAQGEVLVPYEFAMGGRALRVMGADGVLRTAVGVAADRFHGLALIQVPGVTGVPVRWASGTPRSVRVMVAARAVGQPDRYGFGLWVGPGRADVVTDVAGQAEEARVVGSAVGDVPGAPVVNGSGEVLGVLKSNALRFAGPAECAAIPARLARASVQGMMSGGPTLRPYLGLAVQPVDQDLALALGLTEARGALVSDVLPSGPAAEAGVMPGDVVVRVGDFAVNSHVELRALVGRMPADQPIQLEVVREGEVRKLLVKAGVKEPLEVPPPPPPGLPPGQSLLEAVEVGPGPQGQPVVTAFHPHLVVATRPLAVGDRILEVDRNPVESVEDFRALRERTRNADRLLLRIEDGGMRRYLVLKRP